MSNSIKITEAVDIINDKVKSYEKTRPYLDTGGLQLSDIKEIKHFSYNEKPSRANLNIKSGDLILARMQSTVKARLIIEEDEDLMISTGFLVLRPVKSIIEPTYLYHIITSPYFQNEKDRLCSGSTQKSINNSNFKKLSIPLPPLKEQKKIAAILDAADEYRQKTKALIDKYDQLTQSLFLEMFGDLRKYPKEAMKDAVNFIDYRGKSPNKVGSGIPLLTAKNVKVGYISEEPREYIPVEEYEEWMVRGFPKTGNILFTTEAPLGQAALLPHYEKVAIAQRLICFQPNESLDPNYLLHTILSPLFQAELNRRATGSTAKGIRSKELAKIEIPIPPLHVQKEFNKRVQAIKAQKEQAQASLAQAEDLFNSLLQRAFKGELTS